MKRGKIISVTLAKFWSVRKDYSINHWGSGSAFYSVNVNYHIESLTGTLKVNQAVIYDAWKDSENPYFYATTEYYNAETYETDYDVLKPISEEEASTLRDSFPENMSLELTPFDTYKLSTNAG